MYFYGRRRFRRALSSRAPRRVVRRQLSRQRVDRFLERVDAVAELLTEWGAQDEVRAGIPASTKFPKMDTTGANAVMIPLNVDLEDEDDDE